MQSLINLKVVVQMTVIKMRSNHLIGYGERVGILCSRRDRFLGYTGNAVFLVRHSQTMPVNRRRLRQIIFNNKLNFVSDLKSKKRSRYLLVVTPGLYRDTRKNFPKKNRSREIKFLG